MRALLLAALFLASPALSKTYEVQATPRQLPGVITMPATSRCSRLKRVTR